MAPKPRADRLAAPTPTKRESCDAQAPSLPPELWQLIFHQNTNPKHLWTVGRKVCSAWRTEIPKIIAKKYLEDPDMTQIHCDCEIAGEKGLTCLMGSKLIFDHYCEDKTRAVFRKVPEDDDDEDELHCGLCTETLTRAKEEECRSLDGFHMRGALNEGEVCGDCYGSSRSRRCDLPPYQMRVKWDANDTELPGLEANFERGEISFEWRRMLDLFFREATLLDSRDDEIATEALQWLEREKPSIARVVARAREDHRARQKYKEEVRRDRIKRQELDIHCRRQSGLFDTGVEYMILHASDALESPEDASTENREEMRMKEFQSEAERKLSHMYEILPLNRHLGDKEEALLAMWENQLVDATREERGTIEARYAMQWLGRQRI